MNAFSPDDFGDMSDLLKALGLVGGTGDFNSDWLRSPESYLKTMLADPGQRQALLDFVAAMRGGVVERDAEGRQWIELFSESVGGGAAVRFFVVVDDAPPAEVHLFLGTRFETAAPLAVSASSLMFPLFRARKSGGGAAPPGGPELVGRPGGRIAVTTEVTIAAAPAPPGQAGLRAVGLRLSVPTAGGDGDPQIGLTLRGLQLPGETTARDLVLSLTDPDAIRDAGMELILGLIQAQIGAGAGGQIAALARLLGLGGDPAIPDLPVGDVFDRGVDALADWLAAALGIPDARTAWLSALAGLLANGAAATPEGVTLPIGGGALRIGLTSAPGAAGRPVVTLSVGFGFDDAGAEVGVTADLVRIDLGTGAAVAVPALRADLRVDLSGATLSGGDISVDSFVLGFGLNEARRPVLVVELLDVTIFATTHARLDLTNPEAVAATAASAATSALAEILGNLGPGGDLIAVALGWAPPTGAGAGFPTIDPVAFLGDPLGRLRAHWETVLDTRAADLPRVLDAIRALVTGDATPGAVTGGGTAADPWLLPLVAGLNLSVWRDGAGRLLIGMGFVKSVDTLGERCTVIETRVRAAIVALDLATGGASFLPEITVRALGRARGGGRLSTDADLLRFEVDHIGVLARYTPDAGLRIGLEAPRPRLYVDTIRVPLDLPPLDGDLEALVAALTREHWDAIERVVALLAERIEAAWLRDVIEALGWRRAAPVLGQPAPHRLALADLVDDAEAAIRAWLARLLGDAEAAISSRLQPLARFLSGNGTAAFHVSGRGTIHDPWRVALSTPGLPALAAWREPDAPLPRPDPLRSGPLRRWRPGRPGLLPGEIAEAILSEFPEIAGPFGRSLAPGALAHGLLGIAARWQGTDGLVPPPATVPAGARLHLFPNSAAAAVFDGLDLAAILGAAPATVIRVRVLDAAAAVPGLDPARTLDMREVGRDPLAFTPLPAQPGTWDILLAPRAAAALPSGDPDGVRGQVARLRHALSAIAAQPGAAVVADAGAGHAAWFALHEMGAGLDRLIAVGLPLAPAQVPAPMAPALAEVLRRLGELLPDPDPADPDDADLARGRALLAGWLGDRARPAGELALPAGWTGALRGGLALHLVHGVFDGAALRAALTAVAAAGLSLNAGRRAALRAAARITSASVGALLPLTSAAAAGGIAVEGRALVELLGLDLDLARRPPSATPRDRRRVVAGLEIRREGGWLVGGPGAAALPLPLELRSVEIALRLGLGGADPGLDRCEITLHGVRIRGRAFPRLVLNPALPETALGMDGQAAPSTPEIAQLLSTLMAELSASGDAALGRIAEALRAAGILGAGGGFDPLSLSNWIDDPAARLAEVLADPALGARLMALVGDMAGLHPGLSFDPATGRLSVSVSGSTGEPVLSEWALTAQVGGAAAPGGALRLGPSGGTHLSVDFAPFGVSLGLAAADAAALGGVAPSLRLWPTPELATLGRAGLPILAASVVSQVLDGVRRSDAGARPVIDAALGAFGLLQPAPGGGDRAVVPALAFIDPGAWARGAFGTAAGVIRPDRAIAALDALKPLVGVAGPSGVWQIAPGLVLRGRDDSGLVLDLAIDPAQFLPGADLDMGGAFGLRFGADGRVLPSVAVFAGLGGGAAGTRAVHLTVAGSDVRLFLRPAAGGDLGIYPDMAGLAQLATAGIAAALPLCFDAIVDTGSDAGNLLADIGDALLLRTAAGFDGAALAAWATDPAGTLEARWPALVASGLGRLGAALPGGVTVTTPGGAIRVAVPIPSGVGSVVAVVLTPAPFSVQLEATVGGIPFLRRVSGTLRFNATGLARLSATLGPAEVPLVPGIVLRPVVTLDIGSAVADPFIATGLSVDDALTNALRLRYGFASESFTLGFGGDTPAEIAAGIMHFAIDLVGAFLLDIPEVDALLDTSIGTGDVRGLLTGVVLKPAGGLDPEFFRIVRNPGETETQLRDTKLARLVRLIDNIAGLSPSVTVGGQLTIGLARTGGSVGLSLGLADRLAIVTGDVAVWIENDSRWIIGGPPAGLSVGLLRLSGSQLSFAPSLSVDGVGIRIGRSNAPLLSSPLALGSIAFHVFARVSANERLGGAQVQLSDIGAAIGGAEGGNPVAQSMLAETNSGDAALAPAFSPAVSVQTRPAAQGGGIAFRFSAGEGTGPWWLPIRSQFGPIYIDQVGLGVQEENDTLRSLSLLFDGGVSIAGLQAAVDDLSLTYTFGQGGLFEPSSWRVDLAGLAVSADMSGVTLAGGLRKFGTDPNIEYIGMLSARFATYGLSIYGGYASIDDGGGRFMSFFAYGAVLGPFGGPPAFFLTGIGGGFGINREVVPPSDMGQFGSFLMIAALDPAYAPQPNLMDEMAKVRGTFPVRRDRFWFAAGISFTSFALVDGIAVVVVEFGDGFELSIFGLARMALPRPQVALVSIELGLMARFSTEEGVIWIQAQLTDNSWLLHRSARLTGGFAYVSWFKGPNRGQFVLTLGGYHPNFRAEGYPVVPRLGFNWSPISNIVIKAEVYFALTSEAVMAGGLFEASAKFGPAFAHLSFGGNAIVYFDPFRYEADAHARISAGIRIKTFLGTIKLSFSLGAYIEVRGPEFHGKARIEVGPIDITVRFGDSSPVPAPLLSWPDFAAKYLELAPGNRARALSAVSGRGALPPASGSGEEKGTADGSAAHPFDVLSEFELSITSTIPISHTNRPGEGLRSMGVAATLGLAPMGFSIDRTVLTFSLRDANGVERLGDTTRIGKTDRKTGAFPIGVWGPAQGDAKKVPKGKIITATEGTDFAFRPAFNFPIGPFSFNQVESDRRKPLPLRSAGAIRARLVAEAKTQRELLASVPLDDMPAISSGWGAAGQGATARRSWLRERPVPMRVGLLAERIVATTTPGRKVTIPVLTVPVDRIVFGEVKLRGVATQTVRAAAAAALSAETTVSDRIAPREKIARMAPPRLGTTSGRVAAPLLRAEAPEALRMQTLVARQVQPETRARVAGHSAGVGRSGAADRARLDGIAAMIGGQRQRRSGPQAQGLTAGEVAIFDLPLDTASRFATSGTVSLSGAARLVAIGADGRVTLNAWPAARETALPKRARAFAILAGAEAGTGEMAGWLGGSQVIYLGQSLARCRGGFLRAEGASRSRGGRLAGTGWIAAADLSDQSALVETRFDGPAESLAIVLDGTVTEAELGLMALSVRGAKVADARPLLVPYDGKTLIVHALAGAEETGMVVRIGGVTAGRLDGVIGARMTPDRLVARFLGETLDLDLEVLASGDTGEVRATWRAPSAPEPVE